MLGGNLGSLLYGDVSVMNKLRCIIMTVLFVKPSVNFRGSKMDNVFGTKRLFYLVRAYVFYIVNFRLTWVYITLLVLFKNIDCGYSLEPPR